MAGAIFAAMLLGCKLDFLNKDCPEVDEAKLFTIDGTTIENKSLVFANEKKLKKILLYNNTAVYASLHRSYVA